MVIIHKDREAVPVTKMKEGTCFFSETGKLFMVTGKPFMVTDDIDIADNVRMCVDMKTGLLIPFYDNDVQIPVKIISMEVE